MKEGKELRELAKLVCGLTAGLVPPGAGCEWQETQELELKRGPKPLFGTSSTSLNRSSPSRNA
jgi:hypothetical protein